MPIDLDAVETEIERQEVPREAHDYVYRVVVQHLTLKAAGAPVEFIPLPEAVLLSARAFRFQQAADLKTAAWRARRDRRAARDAAREAARYRREQAQLAAQLEAGRLAALLRREERWEREALAAIGIRMGHRGPPRSPCHVVSEPSTPVDCESALIGAYGSGALSSSWAFRHALPEYPADYSDI